MTNTLQGFFRIILKRNWKCITGKWDDKSDYYAYKRLRILPPFYYEVLGWGIVI